MICVQAGFDQYNHIYHSVFFSAFWQIVFKTVENINKAILHLTWCLYLNLKVLEHLADLVCLYFWGCAFLLAYSSYHPSLYHTLHLLSKFRKNDLFNFFCNWKFIIFLKSVPRNLCITIRQFFYSKITFERSSIETDEIENIKDFY